MTSTIEAIAASVSAIVASLALVAVYREYRNQKNRNRLELAQSMIERAETDEMILFAMTSLDWAEGVVPVPQTWRAIIGKEAIKPDIEAVYDAVRPQLTKKIAADEIKLLYRHAFVRLFNHLERIQALVDKQAIAVEDLRPLAWVAHELLSWRYDTENRGERFFMEAIDDWFPSKLPRKLVTALARQFEGQT
jgi:hypothetical protein